MKKTKRTYEEEASNLARVIDIAIDITQKHPPKEFQQGNIEHVINVYKKQKHMALNPKPQFKKISSLNYLVKDVFIYFQEGTGDDVEQFWKTIKEHKLPFKRENKLLKILKKGKIKNQVEYDYVIDTIVPFQQDKMIDNSQVEQLNQLIGNFEKNKSKR